MSPMRAKTVCARGDHWCFCKQCAHGRPQNKNFVEAHCSGTELNELEGPHTKPNEPGIQHASFKEAETELSALRDVHEGLRQGVSPGCSLGMLRDAPVLGVTGLDVIPGTLRAPKMFAPRILPRISCWTSCNPSPGAQKE